MTPLPPSRYFPRAEEADADGLIGLGGALAVDWLLDAYSHGIFPWPMADWDGPIPWWSPDPRAVVELPTFHVPRRLQRTCRGGRFRVSRDRDFEGVIRGCATQAGREGETWITPAMIAAYLALHRQGHAHSVEVWEDERLVGGVYGVAIGGLFSGESMFHRRRDASKVALVHLAAHLRQQGFTLFDIQQFTRHMRQFGAIEIRRGEFLARLADAVQQPACFQATATVGDEANG